MYLINFFDYAELHCTKKLYTRQLIILEHLHQLQQAVS